MERQKVNIWWGPPRKFTARIAERKISWLELFYDLVYVIAISRATHHFAEHPGLSGLFEYAYLFIMIFWGWINGSLYHDLHGSPGIRTRFMTLWQMMAVAALIVCLSSPVGSMPFRTTIALVILQVFITYLWWSVGIYDKAHRVYNKPYTVCFLLSAALLALSVFVEYPGGKTLMWVALFLNFIPPFLVISVLRRQNEDFSLSPNMVERLGLFTIIVFGECVLGVINAASQISSLNAEVWVNFGLGILIVFALWWIFFSVIADRESRTGFLNANLIELTYIPTLASLGIIGASFPGLFHDIGLADGSSGSSGKLFFGAALFVFLGGITVISYLLHYPKEFLYAKRKVRQLLLITGLIIVAITIVMRQVSLVIYLGAIFILLFFIIVVITRIWFVVQLKLMGEK